MHVSDYRDYRRIELREELDQYYCNNQCSCPLPPSFGSRTWAFKISGDGIVTAVTRGLYILTELCSAKSWKEMKMIKEIKMLERANQFVDDEFAILSSVVLFLFLNIIGCLFICVVPYGQINWRTYLIQSSVVDSNNSTIVKSKVLLVHSFIQLLMCTSMPFNDCITLRGRHSTCEIHLHWFSHHTSVFIVTIVPKMLKQHQYQH